MTAPLITDSLETMLFLMTIIFFVPFLTNYLKIPEIIGFIFMGLLIGPLGLNLIEISGSIQLLEVIGLLYIMFIAGLELDIDQFMKVKYKSILFGVITGLFPGMIVFSILFFFLNFSFLQSILLADIVASHTVMTYPIISQIGVSKNESVVISLGATMLTDTLALVLLSVIVVLNNQNGITPNYLFFLLLGLGVFIFLAIVILPRISRFFFSKHHPIESEFQFALLVMLLTAVIANMIHLEGIIGAFIGGLAINRLIPKESRLMRLTEFIGKAFFIPIFIIYIGTIVDIRAFFKSTDVIFYAFILTGSLLIGKFLASFIISKIYGYSPDERTVIFSLTIPQVGATLATLFVGNTIGLISFDFLSAGIIMVVITNFLAPLITSKYAPLLIKETLSIKELPHVNEFTKKILFPFSSVNVNRSTIDLAGFLARQSAGVLFPLIVLRSDDRHANDYEIESVIKEFITIGNELNIQTKPIKRIESDVTEGILNVLSETKATLIIFNWKGQSEHKFFHFSQLIDQILTRTSVPIILARIHKTLNSLTNIVVLISNNEINSYDFSSYLVIVKTISKALSKPIIVYDVSHYNAFVIESLVKTDFDVTYEIKARLSFSLRRLKHEIADTDLIIVNLPLHHALLSVEDSISSDTYFYASISSSNPLLVIYFPFLYKNKSNL